MKRTLSFLLPAAAMLLAACGGANDRPSFPDFQEMADPAAAFADWSAAGDTPCASFVTTDRRFGKSQLPDVEPRTACRLTAWRGERVSAQLLVWSAQPVERLVCTAGVLTSDEGRLPESAVRTRFVRYVMSDEFACGCCKRKPQDFAAVLTADMLDERPSMALEACTVRPVWITVDVPQDAAPGLYRTPVTVACDGDEQRLELAVEVTGRTLPAPSEWRYHLDLWQHPAAVARVEGTEMWSDAHFEALRPVMKPLADAGQKVVTATLNKDPWNNQCYDAYADMIVWTKGADGAWTYDYAAFDRWVEFMEGLGVDKQINCYSMLPWNNMLHYRDAATGEWVDVKAEPGQPAFDEMWRPFLADFVRHLEEKGWLAKTCIAMDERSPEQMEIAVAFLAEHAPQLGIALADNHDSYKRYPQLHDICVSARQEVAPEDIAARRAAGQVDDLLRLLLAPLSQHVHLLRSGRGDRGGVVRRGQRLRRLPALGLQLVDGRPAARFAFPHVARGRYLRRLSGRPVVDPFRAPARRDSGCREDPYPARRTGPRELGRVRRKTGAARSGHRPLRIARAGRRPARAAGRGQAGAQRIVTPRWETGIRTT